MPRSRFLVLLPLLFATTACFHAVVETGLPAGGQTISKPWAHSFVYGLVPPAPIDASNVCRSGVSRVETQHSFLNGLVAALTWSLYTPISIQVTCAADRAARPSGEGGTSTSDSVPGQFTSTIRFERQSLRKTPAATSGASRP